MTLKTYIILAVAALLLVACWLSLGLSHATFFVIVGTPTFLFVYLTGRLLMGVIHRLER